MTIRYLKLTTYLLLGVIIFLSTACASEEIPSEKVINQIIRRGQDIAGYESIAIKATDLLLATKPDQSKLRIYVAVKDNIRWFIYFGRVSDDGNSFVAPYTYSCPHGSVEEMREAQDIRVVSADTLQLARAVKLALNTIISQGANFPSYNTNVFREDDGSITVYITPGNKNPEIILLGGDYKISISPDGLKVLDTTQLHKSILEMPLSAKDDEKLAGAYHTHILNDLPTETDVAIILLNPQLAPHYILGQNRMSRIDADGRITILGKTEEILEIEETNGQKKTR